MGLESSHFQVKKLWRGDHNFQISCQKRLCRIVANISTKRFQRITHLYAALFSLKTSFVKITFSTAKKTKNETKPVRNSESMLKIKVKSFWTFFTFCLCQQLFAFEKFSMETRLYNIFKTKKATKLAKSILKISFKVLLEKILFVTLRRPVLFL